MGCLDVFVEGAADDGLGILEFAPVELIGGELADLRVHTILDAKHVVFYSTLQESFKHAATVLGLIAVLREDSGWQLLLISNKDDLAWLVLERDQIGQLHGLASLIHDQILEVTKCEVAEHFGS